jgi:hypothetical protein
MSLPGPDDPRIPYVHGRDLIPIRRQRQRFRNARRERLLTAEDKLRSTIDDTDRQLVELTERRRSLLDELGSLYDEVRPSWRGCAGRRRRTVSHEEPLPPTADKPTWLWGRELRAVCLALLRRAQVSLTLRQLHGLLHRAGYAISHRTPVKALADALGHEVDVGRAVRLGRGIYGAATGTGTRRGDDGHWDGDGDDDVSTLPDW